MENLSTKKINQSYRWKSGRTILILFVGVVIGAFAGYSSGYTAGAIWAIDIGLNFIEIDVDEEMLKNGILNYQNRISNCFEKIELKNEVVQTNVVEGIFR